MCRKKVFAGCILCNFNWLIRADTFCMLIEKASKSEICLPAEPSVIREREEKTHKSRNMRHATSYTYKLNVAYFIIPKDFWYSEPPCITSTICHLKTSLAVFQRCLNDISDIKRSLLCRCYACAWILAVIYMS